MVDPSKIDLDRISQAARLKIFEYVRREKGVRPKHVGVTPSYFYKIRRGEKPISDKLLAKLLEYLSLDELKELVGSSIKARELIITKNGRLDYTTIAEILKILENESRKDPFLKSLIIDITRKWLEKAKDLIHTYTAKPEHVEKFGRLISDRSRKTRIDHMRYLNRALRDLNWELNPDRLQEYILELKDREGENVARHTSKALKLFIKLVIKDSILYNSFKVVKSKGIAHSEPLTLEQVRMIARNIQHLGAKAYFVLLAETGLRPGEILNLTLDQIGLKDRTIKPLKAGETKRAYLSFFSERTREFLAKEYLPFRKKFINRYEVALRNLGYDNAYLEHWKRKLFPFKDYELRQEIYRASEKAIGRRIRLYDLRAFFASYMSLKGVPGQIIDLLQGRVPPKEFEVLQRHYLAISIEQLKEIYDKAGLIVLN